MTIQHLILKNLIHNETYARNILPFIKEEYFSDTDKTKNIFKYISNFITQYNERPSIEALKLCISESNLNIDDKNSLYETVELYREREDTNLTWIVNETEKFCKDRAIENAIIDSVQILNDKQETRDKGIIPELLKDALAISFDPSVGHDFIEDVDERYDFYHKKEERIPFDIDVLNKITNGGIPKKTLNILAAGVNVGKTLVMCHFATSFVLQNKNVLYITMEMSEEKIAERIDANILDISLDTLKVIPKPQYLSMIEKIKKTVKGKLIIKEFPTAGASVTHFRRLLSELALKKKFVPDVIFIDYLNICASSRIKNNGQANTYVLVKSIAEEVRGLGVEFNVPIVTATQLNRSGFSSSDNSLVDIAECVYVGESIKLSNGEIKRIGDVNVGDQIESNDKFKTVTQVHHKQLKDCVRISLKSGRNIIVSKEHAFPSNNGRKSVSGGLSVGNRLNSINNV